MRVGRYSVNPIDAILAVLVPVTVIGLFAEFWDRASPQDAFRAVLVGDIEAVRRFVGEDYDFLARDSYHRTIVHAAAESGDPEVVAHVLAHGGHVAFGAFDVYGNTPVHLSLGIRTSSHRGSTPTIKTFLEFGADANTKTRMGEPLFETAIEANEEGIALQLLKYGADVDVGMVDGAPLMTTVTSKRMNNLLAALLQRGVSANPETSGIAPLAIAISNLDAAVVRLLIEHGAQKNALVDVVWIYNHPGGRGGSYSKWTQADGKQYWGPHLSVSTRIPVLTVRMTPLDYALFRDRECALALMEHGARADLIPDLLLHAVSR